MQLSLSSRNLPCVLPCGTGPCFCRCKEINSPSHSSAQTDLFANAGIHVLGLETKRLHRKFSCQIPLEVPVTSCHSLFPPSFILPRMAKTARERTNPLLCVTSVCIGRTEFSVPVLHFKDSLDSELLLETVLCRCHCLRNTLVISWILCQLLAT